MRNFLFISCILFSVLSVFAQRDLKPGYIITNSDDTIYGEISYQIDVYNAENCYFKKETNSDPITYKPGQIKAYRIIDGKFFVSRKVTIGNKQREVFLEFLVNGKADIFYLPPSYYFIEKEDQEMHILENTEKIVVRGDRKYYKEGKEYVGILANYMQESPQLYEKIQRSELDQSNLIKIATEFHNEVCPGEECIVYSKEPPKNIFKVGYAVGCNFNGVTVYMDQTDYKGEEWAPGLMTGLEISYHTKGVRERFSMSLGFYYSQVKHNIKLLEGNYNPIGVEYLSKNIMVDLYFNYTYPRYKLKPFIGIGVLYFQTLKNSKDLASTYNYKPGKKSLGPLFDAGFTTDLSQLVSLKFETNYQNGYFANGDDNVFYSYTDNLNFLITVQYKLTK